MSEYTKKLVEHYTRYRNSYRSTDKVVFPLLKSLGIKSKTILDFGCGHGADAQKFVAMGASRVVGIDPSKAMIDLAKKVNPSPTVKYLKTNGRTLPLHSEQFDIAFANFVVHYITDTPRQFKQIYTVLKPGGHFVAVFNCLTNSSKLVNTRIPMVLGKGTARTVVHIAAKSPHEIKSSLITAGFKIKKLSRIANPDAKIDPTYPNPHHFKKQAFVFVAQKQ